jgi:hypothetical protein
MQTRAQQSFKDTQIKQLVNPHNLELIRGNYMRKGEEHCSEQQRPSSQQPVHLMMASWAETCSDNRENDERILTDVAHRRQKENRNAKSDLHSARGCCNLIPCILHRIVR